LENSLTGTRTIQVIGGGLAGPEAALTAARLGCQVEDVTLLRLCRSPRSDPNGFRDDLAMIAARFGLDPSSLAVAVRHGQGLATLRTAPRPDGAPGALLAARDDDSSREEPPT